MPSNAIPRLRYGVSHTAARRRCGRLSELVGDGSTPLPGQSLDLGSGNARYDTSWSALGDVLACRGQSVRPPEDSCKEEFMNFVRVPT